MTAARHGLDDGIWVGGEALIVATLRHCYEAYGRGSFDEAAGRLHPDIELLPASGSAIKGLAGVRAWLEPDMFADRILEPVDVWVVDHRALVRLRARAPEAADGVELRLDAWTVWTFDGFGRVTRAEIYPDGEEAEARQAAGLTDRAADGHWQLPAPGLRVPL